MHPWNVCLAVQCVSTVFKPLGGNLEFGANWLPSFTGTVADWQIYLKWPKAQCSEEKKAFVFSCGSKGEAPSMPSPGINLKLSLNALKHTCRLSALLWSQVHTCGRSIPKWDLCQQRTSFILLMLQLQGTWAPVNRFYIKGWCCTAT